MIYVGNGFSAIAKVDPKGNTNPLSNDTDSDSLPDSWEIQYQLNPLVFNRNEDPDVDGLTNYEEYLHGTDPRVADTDGDTYSDGNEVSQGTDPLDPNSHPVKPWWETLAPELLIAIITAVSSGVVSLIFFLIRRKIKKKSSGDKS